MFANPAEALNYIKTNSLAMVDLKITSLGGKWLHVTIPAGQFTQRHFEEGVGYDGSSGSGFALVESGDVCALPQPDTAFIDPFWERPTISFLCDTITADTHEPFPIDPRTIAKRAVAYMRSTGIADEACMAPEFEFQIFNRVEVTHEPYITRISITSSEVDPRGAAPAISRKDGYFRTPPSEQFHDLRSEIAVALEAMGIAVRYHHHEVGAAGQCEVEVHLAPLVRAADQAMMIKYVIKNLARRHGKLATFMPKPVFGEAGNGMHVHQKLTRGGQHIFFDESRRNYAALSNLALQYIAGLLKHGAALTGLTNPSTNSFKRLVEGYEAPVNLFFSLANRSAAIRVPKYAVSPDEKRIEYRPPDFTCNVYLALAAMLLAGLDGVQSQLDPAKCNFGPFDVDIARQDAEFRARIAAMPRSLDDALSALQADHAFLLKGGSFTGEMIRAWIEAKRTNEAWPMAIRPHPYEYQLYLDA